MLDHFAALDGAAQPHSRNTYHIDETGIGFELLEYLSDSPAGYNSYDQGA